MLASFTILIIAYCPALRSNTRIVGLSVESIFPLRCWRPFGGCFLAPSAARIVHTKGTATVHKPMDAAIILTRKAMLLSVLLRFQTSPYFFFASPPIPAPPLLASFHRIIFLPQPLPRIVFLSLSQVADQARECASTASAVEPCAGGGGRHLTACPLFYTQKPSRSPHLHEATETVWNRASTAHCPYIPLSRRDALLLWPRVHVRAELRASKLQRKPGHFFPQRSWLVAGLASGRSRRDGPTCICR